MEIERFAQKKDKETKRIHDIISSIPRRKFPPWHGPGPLPSAACVNLNRERLRGDYPRRAAILYQNVDKGSQWSTLAPI